MRSFFASRHLQDGESADLEKPDVQNGLGKITPNNELLGNEWYPPNDELLGNEWSPLYVVISNTAKPTVPHPCAMNTTLTA